MSTSEQRFFVGEIMRERNVARWLLAEKQALWEYLLAESRWWAERLLTARPERVDLVPPDYLLPWEEVDGGA